MRKVVMSLIVFAFIGLGTSAAFGQWRELGSKEVDYKVDHDTLSVGPMNGDFRHVRLGVSRAPVTFLRVVLTFGNGTTQEIKVRTVIADGGYTRAIDLKGNQRVIRKVDFWYESTSLERRKALVTLYGGR